MALSVMLDQNGPDWPLGIIIVPTPGTPVSIMSLVDPSSVNAPNQANAIYPATTAGQYNYSPLCQQIAFLAVKAGASHGTTNNTGNIYIVRKGVQGNGNRDDYGAMVWALGPGGNLFLSSAPLVRETFSPYRYFIDADNANDSCLVTLLI